MTEETTTAAQDTTGLTVQDLTLVLQVIQVSASRGAFKADELTAVGGVYDRIFKFLEASGAITREAPTAPAEAAATAAPTSTDLKPAAKAAAAKSKKAK